MEGLDEFFKRSAQAWRHQAAADDYPMTSASLGGAARKFRAGASEALAGIAAETGTGSDLGPADGGRGMGFTPPADGIG